MGIPVLHATAVVLSRSLRGGAAGGDDGELAGRCVPALGGLAVVVEVVMMVGREANSRKREKALGGMQIRGE